MDTCLKFSSIVSNHGGDSTKEFPNDKIEVTIKVKNYITICKSYCF